MAKPEQFGPEGAGEARSDHAHAYSVPPELHIRSNREPLYDDEDRARRTRPIGFTRQRP